MGGKGPCSNNALDFIIEHSNEVHKIDSTRLHWLALSFIVHELVDGQRPAYVHLASTRCHSRDRCSQAFPVFRALLLLCIILNETEEQKNGGGLGTRLVQTIHLETHVVSSPDLTLSRGETVW